MFIVSEQTKKTINQSHDLQLKKLCEKTRTIYKYKIICFHSSNFSEKVLLYRPGIGLVEGNFNTSIDDNRL